MRRAALVVILVLAACSRGDDGVDDVADARALLGRDGAFETGREAGASFARIADGLLALGRECVDDRGRDDERCERHLEAAAFAQVFAADAVVCTEPGIDEARDGLDRFLAGEDELPTVPVCT